MVEKEDELKNRFNLNYFILVASSSLVKPVLQSCFTDVKFRAKFKVVLQKQFLSVVGNHSKTDFFTVN